MTSFLDRLADVQTRVARAAQLVGRHPASIELLPVTKTHGAADLEPALAAGLRRFGENRVQELRAKAQALQGNGIQWVQIGHLQTNKAAYVARLAAGFHALDSLRLAAALDRELIRIERSLPVHIQVNTSGETSKFGIAPEEALWFARELKAYKGLRPVGFMTLAIHTTDPAAIRACFSLLRQIRDRACQEVDPRLHELSMGMSDDFEIAVEEGSTCVRIGQALFGPRETPDSQYWPLDACARPVKAGGLK